MAPPSPADDPRLAVVTVSYGSDGVLPDFLGSIEAASAARPLVAVADNKPVPDSGVARLVTAGGGKYLPMERNRGYGSAINAVVAGLPASVEWVLISNPDVVLGAGSVDRLLAVAAEDEHIGAVGPAILDADGSVYPSARSIPSLRTGIGHALFANLWMNNPWSRAYRNDASEHVARRDAGWLSGACLLVRRTAFDRVGGFDEGYFMYFEDVDLGYRLGKAGFRNVYEPDATVMHTGAHSTEGESSAMISAHHDSARRFLERKYAGALLWPVRVALRTGLAVRSRLAKRRGI
ncbi:glycosyltransferase [Leifsonia sp. LS-T14]|uniref:glycosyltransferase n=1 Tax=unclassified Leifsonia TaxID=2663824 RepID=UPI0035A668E0